MATHLTRLGRPEDIAELALFLAGERGEFITGSNLVIDGGFTALKSQLPARRTVPAGVMRAGRHPTGGI